MLKQELLHPHHAFQEQATKTQQLMGLHAICVVMYLIPQNFQQRLQSKEEHVQPILIALQLPSMDLAVSNVIHISQILGRLFQ